MADPCHSFAILRGTLFYYSLLCLKIMCIKLIQTGIEFRTRRIVRIRGGGNIVSRGIYFFKGNVYFKQSWVETGIVSRSIFDELSCRQPQIQPRRTYDVISTACIADDLTEHLGYTHAVQLQRQNVLRILKTFMLLS